MISSIIFHLRLQIIFNQSSLSNLFFALLLKFFFSVVKVENKSEMISFLLLSNMYLMWKGFCILNLH